MSFDPTYPHPLPLLPPPATIANADFGDLLLRARVELAELKGASGQVPNPLLLSAPAVLQESVASSNIENINTTVAGVLQGQLFPEAEQREPDKEVLRYREALYWGFEHLEKYALSTRLITGIQSRLIPDGNGQYRREQNRIVDLVSNQSRYTPPPANEIARLIGNWENYVNAQDESIDPLLRAIVAHYQFEAIHPFRDGNGRTGRILMMLQLVNSGLLSHPILYISGYINQNRADYYRHLLAVTADGNWRGFIEYMLRGFHAQARKTREDLQAITRLHREIREMLRTGDRKIYSAELVQAIFTYPVITPTKLAAELGMHYTTTSKYLSRLSELGILKAATVGKYHLYANHRLLEILSESS